MQALPVDPHDLYLDGRGRMVGVSILLQGAVAEVFQHAQQSGRNNSQIEGDGETERML